MKFLHYLDQVIFGIEDACFARSYTAEEADMRLSALIWHPSPKSAFSYFISQRILKQTISIPELMGQVSRERVLIFRYHQGMDRTQFRPVFRGKFMSEGNQTFLRGSFSMALSTKIMTILWFGFIICLAIVFTNGGQYELQPAFCLLLGVPALAFFVFYGFGRWVSRYDRDFISERIQVSIRALTCQYKSG